MTWTNKLALEFLDLYRQEPILWYPQHPSHKNRSEVTAAWKNIQSSFSIDCSIIDLKKKKESLMTSFRKYYRLRKKIPHYKVTWFAYSFMESFLSAKYLCNTDDDLETEVFENTEYNQSNDEPKCNADTPEKVDTIYYRPPKIKKSKISECYRSPEEKATIYSKRKLSDDVGDLDECDLYCQLLARKLKKLDEHQRDVAMHEIDNIVFRVKMDGPTQCRSYSTSSPNPLKMKSPVFIVTQQNDHQYEDENMAYPEHSDKT